MAQSKAANEARASNARWTPLLALLAWAASSSLMVIGHKIAMVEKGFHFPLTLTAAEQFTSALAGAALSKAGLLPLGPVPTPRVFVLRVLPSVLSFAGTLYLGNFAYLSLSMAFIQMLKALTPAITLSLCLIGGLERFRLPVLGSVIAITLGTGLTAILEAGSASFDLLGFIAFTASAVLESLRCVLLEVLMDQLRYNAAEVLLYMGLPTGMILAVAAWFVEGPGLAKHGWGTVAVNPLLFLGLGASSAAVNLFSFLAIRLTSSLTFKTVGCMKNVFVVWVGVLMGEHVSRAQLLGYFVAMAGFVYYSIDKGRAQQPAAGSQRTAKKKL